MASSLEYIVNWPSAVVDLGVGYDSKTGVVKASPFAAVDLIEKTTPHSQNIRNITLVQNEEDYDSVVKVAAKIRATYPLWSASAEVDFLKNEKMSSKSLHLTVVASNQKERCNAQLSSLTLTPQARNVLLQGTDHFKQAYGDCFIVGYYLGGMYLGDLTISSQGTETREQIAVNIAAQVKGLGWSVNGSVAVNTAQNNANRVYQMTGHMHVLGIERLNCLRGANYRVI